MHLTLLVAVRADYGSAVLAASFLLRSRPLSDLTSLRSRLRRYAQPATTQVHPAGAPLSCEAEQLRLCPGLRLSEGRR